MALCYLYAHGGVFSGLKNFLVAEYFCIWLPFFIS